ncbi:hypothetical protein GCM10011515_02320 [Tsuneonella deserti]|uniref:DUF1674 domain-containing protein n=2 Tax=Tsuneonella deserti TaxID=2035528 RepID=A0ABQ1S179_9SPHN|nr:hypothetical protein GCM10011515_02320 [Tsuneonella deserti]
MRSAAVRAANPWIFAIAMPLKPIASRRQRAHLGGMERATKRPREFVKPAHWTSAPPPKPSEGAVNEPLSPTRYGDWVKDGIAIDF